MLECGDKFYKIGVATSMKSRLGSIKVGNPFPVYVVTKHLVENAHEVEKEIHHRLKKRRTSGEWFKLEPAEVVEVCVLINSREKQKRLFRCKTVLDFGNRKIIDTSRRLWTIQRQELFEKYIEATQLTGIVKPVVIKKRPERDIIIEAELLIKQHNIASASFLQRKMKIGYVRAARVLDSLEEKGVVGHSNGSKPREIINRGVL